MLNVKFGWDAKSAATTMRTYLDAGVQVRIAGNIRYVCRDRDDDMVVACALIAGARMIVSGDNDLLSLGTYSGISLLSPAEYLRQRAAAAKPG